MDIFDDRYISTLGTKISKKQLKLKKKDLNIRLTLSIWDVLGQKHFKNVQAMAFKGAKAAMLVCDITREDTLQNLLNWKSQLNEVTGEIPIILLANKSDLTNNYDFTERELRSLSSELDAPYYITSAKFGDNVIKTFYKIGDLITSEILEK
jgi:small GTP-binding protein